MSNEVLGRSMLLKRLQILFRDSMIPMSQIIIIPLHFHRYTY